MPPASDEIIEGQNIATAILVNRLALCGDMPFEPTMLDETLPLTPPEWPEWAGVLDRLRRASD